MPATFVANLLIFARMLRSAGLTVRAGGLADAIEALGDIGIERKRDVRDTLRTVFICRHEDFKRFDELFERFWRVWPTRSGTPMPQPMHVPPRIKARLRIATGIASNADDGHQTSADDQAAAVQIYSADEAWRRKDFSTFSEEDLARARAAIAKLRWSPGLRVTRRWVDGRGSAIDWRRLLKANAKH